MIVTLTPLMKIKTFLWHIFTDPFFATFCASILGYSIFHIAAFTRPITEANFPEKNLFQPNFINPDHSIQSIAYLLMAHDRKSMKGLLRIVNSLYHPKHFFFFHIDAKVELDEFNDFKNTILSNYGNSNVIFDVQRVDVKWGSFEIVQAEINLLESAVNLNKKMHFTEKWTRAHFLCGYTIPLHSREYIDMKFANFPAESNIVFDFQGNFSVCEKTPFDPCNRTPARCLDRLCTQMHMTPNNGVIYKGQQWVSLSQSFAEFLFGEGRAYFEGWISFFKSYCTFAPDELFFQTLLMNSRYRETAALSYNRKISGYKTLPLLYVRWNDCKSFKSARSQAGESPCDLGIDDIDSIDFNFLFARKVAVDDDDRLYRFINERIIKIETTRSKNPAEYV
ncbi:hypothetical protein ROZALSC1DRAFT_20659 [Rozella allomycis CSF55]|uniref:protein xylosyltransferase n=1 Tax=Rozella allomycis (strain CSF55) TaxID=988480 RepID=A0A4P9YNT5_ROZAC|nr:hypothetical protein ROZALSC1DRAFT_20659 [Rozella allomycis CSF55]